MTAYARLQIAAVCYRYGSTLTPLPEGVNGVKVLWGLAGNESSFGANCAPRHEAAFDVDGAYAHGMEALLTVYPPVLVSTLTNPPGNCAPNSVISPAACSYGPWQLLLCNAPEGTSPNAMADLPTATQATVSFLNKLLRRWSPTTLAAVGECWNAGRPLQDPGPGVIRYTSQLAVNYAVPMPL